MHDFDGAKIAARVDEGLTAILNGPRMMTERRSRRVTRTAVTSTMATEED